MRLQIEIERHAMGYHVRLSGDDAEFSTALAGFKAQVPKTCRRFIPDARCWHVEGRAACYLDRWVEDLLGDGAEVYYDGELLHETCGDPDPAPSPADPMAALYRELFLVPGAPMKLIEAARRILAVENHPDRGGDEERMKRVNVAFDMIQQIERRRETAA